MIRILDLDLAYLLLRPQRGHDHTDRDPQGNLSEPVDCNQADRLGVRHEHDNGQRDPGKTIRGSVQPQGGAEQAHAKHASAECNQT